MAHWDGDRMTHRDAPAPCSAQDLLKGCLRGQGRPQAHQRGGQEMSSPMLGQRKEMGWRDRVAWHGTVAMSGTMPWRGTVSGGSVESGHVAVAWHGGVSWHSSGTCHGVVTWHGGDPALCSHWGRRGDLPWQNELAQRDSWAWCRANVCVCACVQGDRDHVHVCGHAGCPWPCTVGWSTAGDGDSRSLTSVPKNA